jgi:hypothetical protein
MGWGNAQEDGTPPGHPQGGGTMPQRVILALVTPWAILTVYIGLLIIARGAGGAW